MEIDPQIHFRGMDPSPAVEARIRQRIERLERFHGRLTSCTVTVEAPHRHGHKGQVYHVRIDVTLPGGEVVVNREPERNHAHEDAYVAIRDAFAAAERQVEDVARRMSGHRVKAHPDRLHGTIARIERIDGFGFIRLADGREVYFDMDSMSAGDWDALKVGDEVRFSEHAGEKGAYASAVAPAGAAE